MVVDGNIERVMSRLFAIATPLPAAKPALHAAASRLAPPLRPGDYAQAVMDLGATICTPRNLRCMLCPWADACVARTEGSPERYPYRSPKAERPTKRAVVFVLMKRRCGLAAPPCRRRLARRHAGGAVDAVAARCVAGERRAEVRAGVGGLDAVRRG